MVAREEAGRGDADEQLADLAAEGLALLDRATQALRRAGDGADAETVNQSEDRARLLTAFGTMFQALAAAAPPGGSAQYLIAACNGLAVYLDDENHGVVDSAKLWMGVAYRRAGRPERALQVLRPIVSRPANLRVGLLARLERCLAMGDRGDHVAALAICSRIGGRIEDWFEKEDLATQRQAADAVLRVRMTLQRGWAERLQEAGETDAARRAKAAADKLLEKRRHPPPPGSRPFLAESISGLPPWEEPTESPKTQPSPQKDRA